MPPAVVGVLANSKADLVPSEMLGRRKNLVDVSSDEGKPVDGGGVRGSRRPPSRTVELVTSAPISTPQAPVVLGSVVGYPIAPNRQDSRVQDGTPALQS